MKSLVCGLAIVVAALARGQITPRQVPYETRLRAQELFLKGLQYSEDSIEEHRRQVSDIQASLKIYEFPDFFQRTYLYFLAEKAQNLDLAFETLESLYRDGWFSVGSLLDFPAEHKALFNDPRWGPFESKALQKAQRIEDAMSPKAFGLDFASSETKIRELLSDSGADPAELYHRMTKPDVYRTPLKTGDWMKTSTTFTSVKGEQKTITYLIYIPKSYRATHPTPTVLFSHQGWFYRPMPVPWHLMDYKLDNPYWSSSEAREWTQIYPLCYSALDGSTRAGQRVFLQILREVKAILNVDDDRVVIAGHSNGGSVAYRALAEETSPFAGFVALNGWPDPRLPMRNWSNRTGFTLSGDEDTTFLPANVRALHTFAQQVTSSWRLTPVPRGDHDIVTWIDDYRDMMVKETAKMKRDPFAKTRIIQANSNVVTRIDWCQIDAIDADRPRADWQTTLITPSMSQRGDGLAASRKGIHLQDALAGVATFAYRHNRFEALTSRVAKVTIFISPEMVDLSRPVTVEINGKIVFHERVDWDRALMTSEYVQNFDKREVWCAALHFNVAP